MSNKNKVKNPIYNHYVSGAFINCLRVIKSSSNMSRIINISTSYTREGYFYNLMGALQGIRICLKKIK